MVKKVLAHVYSEIDMIGRALYGSNPRPPPTNAVTVSIFNVAVGVI